MKSGRGVSKHLQRAASVEEECQVRVRRCWCLYMPAYMCAGCDLAPAGLLQICSLRVSTLAVLNRT